jgi:hypothetical protein
MRGDVMGRFHNAMFLGDVHEQVRAQQHCRSREPKARGWGTSATAHMCIISMRRTGWCPGWR